MKKKDYVIIDQLATFAGPDDYVKAESPMAAMMWWRERWNEESHIEDFAECEEGEERFIVRDLKTSEETYYKSVLSRVNG